MTDMNRCSLVISRTAKFCRDAFSAALTTLRSCPSDHSHSACPGSDGGQGCRAPVVFYNRSNEAAAQLQPTDFDWAEIFAKNNVRWFHSGGIFSALSESTPEVIIAGMTAAKAAGCKVSFDLNYRAKLWNLLGGLEKCQEVMSRIAALCDVLVGNEEDLQLGLGIKVRCPHKMTLHVKPSRP